MFETQDTQFHPGLENPAFDAGPATDATPVVENTSAPEVNGTDATANGSHAETADWHAEAGRKGAHRIHQLIQEGKLYEQEHGLKSGRQRLRQLIELGKLYEQEHGIQPERPKKSGRLSRGERQELLATLVQCLIRVAKPSFRSELAQLAAALQAKEEGPAA